jgi:hypothetical protein
MRVPRRSFTASTSVFPAPGTTSKLSQTTAQWTESRLSAMLCLSITTTDYPLSRLSALLCLAIYYNRLSCVLYSVWRSYVQPTISSALPVDITIDYPLCSVWCYTTTDSPMCSTLSDNTTLDYTLFYAFRYYNRLSTLIYMAIL